MRKIRLKAINIDNPPSLGIGRSCIFLSPGKSIAPDFLETNLTNGVRMRERVEAARKRIKYLSINLVYSVIESLGHWVKGHWP